MAVQAKFFVSSVTTANHSPGQKPSDHKIVKLSAATYGEENKSWAKWTPGGSIELTITNPDAYEQFVPGQYVMVTLQSVPFEQA